MGSATGLAYGEPGARREHDTPGAFTQVYLEPEAFRHFRETGEFPEGTTFVLDIRKPTTGISIARDGWRHPNTVLLVLRQGASVAIGDGCPRVRLPMS